MLLPSLGLLLLLNSCSSTNVCGIDKVYRIDCFPEISPGIEESCAARGCCYSPGETSEDVPWCFYPTNYSSYEVAKIQETDTGIKAVLQMKKYHKTRIEGEIPLLMLDVKYQTENRLRFTLRDVQKSRFEVPIHTPSESTFQSNINYSVKLREDNFGIIIQSLKTKTTVFDSTIGPLIYADQFLQLSSYLPSTKVYGLGERHSNSLVSLDWNRIVMWARDQQPHINDNLYGDHPFMLVIHDDGTSFGVFFLNSNAKEVTFQPAPAVTWRTIGGVLDFFIFMGPSPQEVVQQYMEVIGKPYLPPYWGLGFHLCRWGYGSSDNTWKYVNKTRAAFLPQDVQWNDIEYARSALDFTYNNETYQSLPNMVEDLHRFGQKYMMIVDPGISNQQPAGTYPPYDEGLALGIFVNQSDKDAPIEGKVWPGKTVFPDFSNPAIVGWWTKQLKSYHDQIPFDGAWIDMNEPSNFVEGSTSGCPGGNRFDNPPYLPKVAGAKLNDKTLCMSARHHGSRLHYNVHSMYGLFEMIATNKALLEIRQKRPFIISRSTFPSSGRYGGHWTGDVHSTWQDMRQSVVGITNFNMFGIPLVGADICGFAGNTNEEMCIRWTQLGAFYPFSRNHNSIDQRGQAPVDFSASAQTAMRRVLMQRYTYLPYLYTLFYAAHARGQTVARGLYLEFPHDRQSLLIDEQFLWGSALMISPVLYEGLDRLDVYFPPSVWYDFYKDFGRKIHSDGEWLNLAAPLDLIPLHIRGGSIIPGQIPALNTVESRRNKFVLFVALCKRFHARGSLYWDDGDNVDGIEFTEIEFQADKNILVSQILNDTFNEKMLLGEIYILGLDFVATKVANVVTGEPLQFEVRDNNVLKITCQITLFKPLNIRWS